MIPFFHLTTIFLFGLFFTGTPASLISKSESPKKANTSSREKKENEEFIPWTYERMLDWNDFQCAPQRGTEAVATTNTTLGLAFQLNNGELSYQITCKFSKKKSWGSMKTDYILAHEQAHFDITELYARQLYKELKELKEFNFHRDTYQKDIAAIYNRVVKDKEAFQQAYDEQTDHSRKRRAQIEWLERIEKLLVETEAYETYP